MKNTLLFAFLLTSFSLAAQSPNFVFILADDMGWTGTSLQVSPTETDSKSDFYETPNIEALAAAGISFSQAYAPAPKCSPTRCSILTGQTTARNGFTETGNPNAEGEILLDAPNINSIDIDDITIAEWLNSTGLNYRTAHFGKWHLNSDGPGNNGFSHHDGNNGNGAGDAADGNTIQEDPKQIMELANKGIEFMQDAVAANEPFYLQLSEYAVHSAVETTQDAQDHFAAKTPGTNHNNVDYAGMTRDLDDGIGLILAEIEALGIEGDTYVIFMSDNGAQTNYSDNTPLRLGKGFLFEGGIRVPMIIRGPGISAGSISTETAVGYDLFPTIADWTESNAALPILDGESLKEATLQGDFTRSEPLYFHSPHYANGNKKPRSALTDGNYKFIINYETGQEYLFDFNINLREVANSQVAADNPALTLELKIKLRDHLKSVNANMPTLNPNHANFSGMTPDIDEDTLMDEWEFRELLSYHYGPTDDPDNDGADNLTEMNNGTDPLINEMVSASIDVPNSSASIRFYPNPTTDVLHLEFLTDIADEKQIELRIFATDGKLVRRFNVGKAAVLTFSLSDLPKGVYAAEVYAGKNFIGTEQIVRE